jgi:hypothetical protein
MKKKKAWEFLRVFIKGSNLKSITLGIIMAKILISMEAPILLLLVDPAQQRSRITHRKSLKDFKQNFLIVAIKILKHRDR